MCLSRDKLIKKLGLLNKSDICQAGVLKLRSKTGSNTRRMTNKKNVDHIVDPVARNTVKHMLRHMFLIVMRLALGNRSEQVRNDLRGIGWL